jgi:hypothetical protein
VSNAVSSGGSSLPGNARSATPHAGRASGASQSRIADSRSDPVVASAEIGAGTRRLSDESADGLVSVLASAVGLVLTTNTFSPQ